MKRHPFHVSSFSGFVMALVLTVSATSLLGQILPLPHEGLLPTSPHNEAQIEFQGQVPVPEQLSTEEVFARALRWVEFYSPVREEGSVTIQTLSGMGSSNQVGYAQGSQRGTKHIQEIDVGRHTVRFQVHLPYLADPRMSSLNELSGHHNLEMTLSARPGKVTYTLSHLSITEYLLDTDVPGAPRTRDLKWPDFTVGHFYNRKGEKKPAFDEAQKQYRFFVEQVVGLSEQLRQYLNRRN